MAVMNPTFLGNPAHDWFRALAGAGASLLAFYGLRVLGGRIGGRVPTRAQEGIRESLRATRFPLVLALALWTGSRFLVLAPRLETGLMRGALLVLLLQAWLWGNRLIGYWLRDFLGRREAQFATAAMTAPVVGLVARLVLGSLLLLAALDAFEVNPAAFLASVGVGGIAVALAVQNVLGDMFAALSIALDKPFVLGDFIIVGDVLGTVDGIGLKSTRIRSLSGEQIVLANADLLKSRIHNYKRMAERRVVFGFGLACGTEAGFLEAVPGEVRRLVEAQDRTRFDRAHLKEFGDSGLIFEAVYYVLDPDYNLYMDIQQAINLGLLRACREAGAAFAHPVRVILPYEKRAPEGPLPVEPAAP